MASPDPEVGGAASEELRVVFVSPTGETELAPYVSVVFSKAMVPLGIDGEPIAGSPPARLEPEVPGSWRWLDVRTLRFEPDRGRLPGATAFTVEVPGSVRATDGTPMSGTHEVTFRTAGPRVLGGFPSRDLPFDEGLADLMPTILLTFDQAVDGPSVLDAAELVVDSASRAIRLVSAEELDDRLADVVHDVGDELWVALRPIEPLPPGGTAVLTLDAGLPSEEGALPAGRDQELRFHVRDALRVTGVDCFEADDLCPPRPWAIHLSNPLEPGQPISELVRIEPSVEDFRASVYRSGLWLSGDFRPHTSYRVELSPDIEDTFGQRLGRRTEVVAHFWRPVAFVRIPGAPFLVLDPASNHRVELAARSLDSLRLELYDVDPDEWTRFRRSLLRPLDERYQAWPPPDREPMARWTVEPEDGGRGYTRIPLDLSRELEGGGHAVLVAHGIQADPVARDSLRMLLLGRPPARAATWIQSTSFALGSVWNPEELVAWAVDAADGDPAQGVRLRLSDQPATVTTDRRGLGRIGLAEEPSSVLFGFRDDEVAILPAMAARAPRERWVGDPRYPAPLWLAITDRGLYRPGEELVAHGWVRELAGRPRRDLALPTGIDEVSYRVRSPRADVVDEGVLPVGDHGTFHLVVGLPDDARSGTYRIDVVARAGGEEIPEWTSQATFRVEEFRRPEYEVLADVDLGPHLPGDRLQARATARYFDGSALAGGSVDWVLTTYPTVWHPPGWQGWHFGGGSRTRQWSSGQARFSGGTDRSGTHALRVEPGILRDPVPVNLHFRVEVRDVNRQAGSAFTWTVVHPGVRTAGIRLDRYWVMTEEDVELDVVVLDLDGLVDPDVAPVVRAFLEPDPRRQEAAEREVAVPVQCSRGAPETNAEQSFRPLRCVLRPSVSGRYRLEAEVADAEGRRSLTRAWVTAWGGSSWGLPTDRMVLTPDRDTYEPGDTARLLVEAPYHPMRALLTVSRFGIREVRPLTLDAPRTNLELVIHPEDVGTLQLQLEASPMTRARPDRSATTTLTVDPERRRLDVFVAPSRDTVAPGEEVDVDVRVTDASGSPAPGARAAVWVVDESVLALAGYRLPDPHSHFYGMGRWDRLSFSLPHRLIRWERRAVGPGVVSAEILDAATGAPQSGLMVQLEGTDHEGSVIGGGLLLEGVAPGTYRLLLLSRDGAVVLERAITVPAAGLDLGTLVASDPRERALALEAVVVSGRGEQMSRMSVEAVAAGLSTTTEASQEVAVRSRFDALAAFRVDVTTDADGRARVTIRLPDTMTRYRIFAVATEGPGRFGKAEGAVTASRNLVVRATPPRVLHPGDRPELPVTVQNASDRRALVDVVARTHGLRLDGVEGYRLDLAPGAHQEVRFPATATGLGTGDLEVLAVGGLDGEERTDAVRVPVPVSPPLAPRAAAVHDRVPAGSAVSLAVQTPQRAHPDFGSLEVGLSTTLLLPLVDVLRGLCLEPLLWPEATAARVLGLAGIDPALESLRATDLPDPDELRDRTALDVQRLDRWLRPVISSGTVAPGFLSSVGTLNAIHALIVAEQAGYQLPENWRYTHLRTVGRIWSSELALMSREAAPTQGYRVATPAYALHVASRLGDSGISQAGIGREWIDWVASLEPADLPVEALGWLVGPASTVAELAPVREALLDELTNRALTTGTTATMRQGGRAVIEAEGIRRLLLASSRRSDAVALMALLEETPDHPLIPALVQGLVGHRDGTRLAGAHENAWVLLALGAYASVHESDPSQVTARVALDDQPLTDEAVLGGSAMTTVAEGPAPAPGNRATIRVDTEGTGSLYVRAGIRYAPLVTLDTPAEERGFLVSRRYEAVDDSLDVRHDADGTWRIRAGARVRVRITFSAPARRYRVQLQDPIPGGLEALNPRLRGTGFADDPSPPPAASLPPGRVSDPVAATILNAPYGWDLSEMLFRWRASQGRWASHEELRDDKMEAYTPLMLAGTYQTTYLVRATTPGTFLVPPPRVEETEHPETYAQSRPDLIVVAGER